MRGVGGRGHLYEGQGLAFEVETGPGMLDFAALVAHAVDHYLSQVELQNLDAAVAGNQQVLRPVIHFLRDHLGSFLPIGYKQARPTAVLDQLDVGETGAELLEAPAKEGNGANQQACPGNFGKMRQFQMLGYFQTQVLEEAPVLVGQADEEGDGFRSDQFFHLKQPPGLVNRSLPDL